MKNVMLMAALTMVSASAFASKARMTALQGGYTTATDIQQVFEAPSKMWDISDQATFEFGETGNLYNKAPGGTTSADTSNVTAEGGFVRTHENSRYGLYLGHQSESLRYMLLGAFPNGTLNPLIKPMTLAQGGLHRMENPINLWYGLKAGDLNYGFNLYYANSELKTGTDMNKKSAAGVSFGVGADKWNANAVVGLGASVENNKVGATDNEEFKATSSFKVKGEYVVNDMLLAYGNITQFGGKHTATTGSDDMDFEHQDIGLGVESKIKSDVAHFYYGASLNWVAEKNKATAADPEKIDIQALPVYFGLEADAASWLVLRASLSQNFLINNVKVSGTTVDGANNTDTTVAAAGLGFRFGKLMLDGVASAGTTGKLSTTDFATNASLTYLF